MLRALAAAIRQLSLFDRPEAPEAVPQDKGKPAVPRAPHPAPPSPSAAAIAVPGNPRVTFVDLCRGPYAHIRVETSARLRESWKVTWNRRQEALLLRLPAALDHAPDEVKRAALRWAVLVSKRRRKADPLEKAERRALEEAIRSCLAGPGEGPHQKRRLAANRRRMARLNPRGACHDLDAVLSAVNGRYFGGALEARITWATRLGGLSTHRLAEDGDGKPYHLLTISRGYDCPEVTPEILGGVVYHECLHIAIPPRKEGGRRVVHGRDFRLRERQYEHYEVWRRWHREGLPKALRRMLRAARWTPPPRTRLLLDP